MSLPGVNVMVLNCGEAPAESYLPVEHYGADIGGHGVLYRKYRNIHIIVAVVSLVEVADYSYGPLPDGGGGGEAGAGVV